MSKLVLTPEGDSVSEKRKAVQEIRSETLTKLYEIHPEAREQIKGQILLSLESPAVRMHRLAATALYDEPYRPLDALAELIDGIGPEEAERAASLYDPEGVAILELVPA